MVLTQNPGPRRIGAGALDIQDGSDPHLGLESRRTLLGGVGSQCEDHVDVVAPYGAAAFLRHSPSIWSLAWSSTGTRGEREILLEGGADTAYVVGAG